MQGPVEDAGSAGLAKPREGWLYEEKVDGYRVLAYKAGETWQEVLESKGRPGS